MSWFNFKKEPLVPLPDLSRIEAVCFDLDGTLIEVDMQVFVPAYLQRLSKRLSESADPRAVVRVMRESVFEMLNGTDGQKTLEQLLTGHLQSRLSITPDQYRQSLEDFCREDLAELRPLVEGHRQSRALAEACLARGWRLVLATNPIFPLKVIEARLDWGGLSDLPFEIITAYETARYCKPHAAYFKTLLETLELPATNCLMIGNDTQHDMAAGQVGIATCLLSTWQIDRPGQNYPASWQGSHQDLLSMIDGEYP